MRPLYYELDACDLAARLAANETVCNLFLSTNTEAKGEHLRHTFAEYRGRIDVRVAPNQGRHLGPFLTGLAYEISNGEYDVFGQVHAKRSVGVYDTWGDLHGNRRREFLWENLIGGTYVMLELAISALAGHPDIGLLIAEEPHLVGWDENRAISETLAARMGIVGPLEDFIDFAVGAMFWPRPNALQLLLALQLEWEDYPPEPLPANGTLLHALERLVPFATKRASLRVAGLRVLGTTW